MCVKGVCVTISACAGRAGAGVPRRALHRLQPEGGPRGGGRGQREVAPGALQDRGGGSLRHARGMKRTHDTPFLCAFPPSLPSLLHLAFGLGEAAHLFCCFFCGFAAFAECMILELLCGSGACPTRSRKHTATVAATVTVVVSCGRIANPSEHASEHARVRSRRERSPSVTPSTWPSWRRCCAIP